MSDVRCLRVADDRATAGGDVHRKLGEMVFEIRQRTEKKTDKQKHTRIAMLRFLTGAV